MNQTGASCQSGFVTWSSSQLSLRRRNVGLRLFSAVSATDQVSRMQTSASTIFRFICTNNCDTYVHTRKEALYVCCYIPGR
ncbi:hypothetical protein F1645_00760 [Novacetimonas hansenii]